MRQRTFSQRSPKGKQNEIVVLFMVVLFKRTRGPGEKKTQKMRKEEEQGEKNTKQKHASEIRKENKGQKET